MVGTEGEMGRDRKKRCGLPRKVPQDRRREEREV